MRALVKRSELSRASLAFSDIEASDSVETSSDPSVSDRQLSKFVVHGQEQHQLVSEMPSPPVSAALGAKRPSNIAKMVWNDSVDQSGMAEMCQYVQHLETEKCELQDQVHLLREQDARQRVELSAAATRIELLQSSLQHAMVASEAHREEKDAALALQATERDRITSLIALLEEAQKKYEDTERARQHAVYKLSALQASVADEGSQRLVMPQQQLGGRRNSRGSLFASHVSQDDMSLAVGERIEMYKREMELLRQKLELTNEQASEKQRIAVELALRSAHSEHTLALEALKLECELRLSEWRHDETARAREIEAAVDEDRYSIRLEMKHALQRAQIEQRVSYLQAQAALSTANCAHHGESAFSFGTLDEVLVRMQLEQLRTRRFEALKRVLLIRHSKLEQASRALFCRWRIQTTSSRILKLNAVLHMHRIVSHLGLRKQRACFYDWKAQTRLLHVRTYQSQALSCWNRMLAAERISHVLRQRQVQATLAYLGWSSGWLGYSRLRLCVLLAGEAPGVALPPVAPRVQCDRSARRSWRTGWRPQCRHKQQ